MDPVTIEVALPGLIDGSPFDVEKRALADLATGIDDLAGWLDEASKQLANTERSRILAGNPSLSGEALAEAYENSPRAGQLARMIGAAKALSAAAAELSP
jgi:hypothetical protein